MVETAKPATKKPPKGGRKGGTLFPKINLQQALDFAKKLVAKTHIGPQPEKTILPGVFGSAGATGKVRASALKQFGLLEGGVDAYQATKLAKDIDAAPPEDRPPLLQRAFRSSKLFNQIYETFHGDTVSKAKVEQRARGLEVHPDSADECAQLFIDSATTAGLGTISGDSLVLVSANSVTVSEPGIGEGSDANEQERREAESVAVEKADAAARNDANDRSGPAHVNKPGLTVSLNVDSSSDPDKLEKQLKLLREFGVI